MLQVRNLTRDIQLLGKEVHEDRMMLVRKWNITIDLSVRLRRLGGLTSQAKQVPEFVPSEYS
jgi:hypothetical protein